MSNNSNSIVKQTSDSLITNSVNYFMHYLKRSVIFISIFFLFCSNLFALVLSLACNRPDPIHIKIVSGIFAFMFGFLYIIMNYMMYRVQDQGYACIIPDGRKHSIFSL